MGGGEKMKRFALCFALVIILALAVQPLIYSNSQGEVVGPDGMEGTQWAAYVFQFDSETGEYLGWFEDTFEFSGGIFCAYGLDCAPYAELDIPQGTIWGSKIVQGDQLWHFKGIRPINNPRIIAGKIDTSGVGMYFKFFGNQIASDAEGKKATSKDWGK